MEVGRWRENPRFNLCCVTEITAKPRRSHYLRGPKWEPERPRFGATMERNAKNPKCPLFNLF